MANEKLRIIQAVDISKGIKFECTHCGACCRRPGKIGLRADEVVEVEDLALALGIDVRIEASPNYSDVFHLQAPQGCPLYDGINGRCLMGKDRPLQCRAYPFWPTILRDSEFFAQEKELCEGIGQGKTYRPKEIVEIIRNKSDGT